MSSLVSAPYQYVIFQKNGVFNTPPHVYSCSSIPIFDSKRYITFHKIFVVNSNNSHNDEMTVDLIITYEKIDNDECNMKFVRGFMYCNNVEYVIDTFLHFQMLQYGHIAYKHISFCNCEFEIPFLF